MNSSSEKEVGTESGTKKPVVINSTTDIERAQNKAIGARLKCHRVNVLDIKQRPFAKGCGVSTGCLAKWEAGKGKPSSTSVTAIMEFTGMTREWILEGKIGKPSIEEETPIEKQPEETSFQLELSEQDESVSEARVFFNALAPGMQKNLIAELADAGEDKEGQRIERMLVRFEKFIADERFINRNRS